MVHPSIDLFLSFYCVHYRLNFFHSKNHKRISIKVQYIYFFKIKNETNELLCTFLWSFMILKEYNEMFSETKCC